MRGLFLDAPALKSGASYLVTWCLSVNFFTASVRLFDKNHRISKNPKQEHVSAHSEQLKFF